MTDALCCMPLEEAYLCPDCAFVGNDAKRCPKCLNASLMSLAAVLNREEKEEAR